MNTTKNNIETEKKTASADKKIEQNRSKQKID